MFKIGTIVNTHGIKGEVKIKQLTDFDERFDPGEIVYIQASNKEQPLTVATSRRHKQMMIVQFKDYQYIEDVEDWKGKDLYIKENQQQELGENEYYYHEIIGCGVITTDGTLLGSIDSILAPGANDVWVVKSEAGKEILIPYIADVVKQVDVPNKTVTIELMEGLMD